MAPLAKAATVIPPVAFRYDPGACAVLCCAVLCCAVLCCAVLCSLPPLQPSATQSSTNPFNALIPSAPPPKKKSHPPHNHQQQHRCADQRHRPQPAAAAVGGCRCDEAHWAVQQGRGLGGFWRERVIVVVYIHRRTYPFPGPTTDPSTPSKKAKTTSPSPAPTPQTPAPTPAPTPQNPPTPQILDASVSDPFIRNWMNLLCFLLSGLPADGTIAAEVAYMHNECEAVGALGWGGG